MTAFRLRFPALLLAAALLFVTPVATVSPDLFEPNSSLPPGSADAAAKAGTAAAPPLPRLPVLAAVQPANPLAGALAAAAQGDWVAAEVAISAATDPLAAEILLWVRLSAGAGTWEECVAFLARHPNWPGLAALRRAGERLIPEEVLPVTISAYFDGRAPETGHGSLSLAAARGAQGNAAAAEAEAARGWRELSLSPGEQVAFRRLWGEAIAAQMTARLDMLLWQGWTREAEAMLPLVDPGWRALARARIAARGDAPGLQAAIRAVPQDLKADPGLAFERYRYRVTKGRWDEAEAVLRAASASAETLGRPDMWMERREAFARRALARGDVEGAYAIAAGSHGSGGGYADCEWLAGYIALERMDDPKKAAGHFRRLREMVFTPISLGRAGYWLGRALEAAGDRSGAEAAWREAGVHQTSFYGQLAAEKAGLPPDPRLAEAQVPGWRRQPIVATSVVRAAVLLHEAGDDERAIQFLRHAADRRPAASRAAVAEVANAIGLPHAAVRIGKDAAADGLIMPAQYYPLHPIATERWPVPAEYALAVARQESEFNPAARSTAGARGMMQLMPATARQVAAALGTPLDLGRLGTDPTYNARFGTEYLRQMLTRYRGSYILATAAYNAGPGRVDAWLKQNGDPRDGAVDPVDWVEAIPFSETRNYVMRVMEALHVYRVRLGGAPAPLRLSADLTRTL